MSYMDDFRHLEIKLEDVKAATNNFTDKPIGSGGFGAVYKGELLLPNGRRTVAFKRLDRKFGQGDVEFWKEIMMLSELKHKNLASLLHFCREDEERILVYEYASRRSLDGYLDKATLTWTQRLRICIGAATAIAYLHDPKKTQQRVVHRDIKSLNILLDDEWIAKVSDFGLSKITPANQPRTYLVSNIVGTPGYCDPAYYDTGILSKECDVYSLGVVLFEVICGRLCYEFEKGRLIYILVHTWKSRYDEDRLDDIILPDLKQQIDEESLSTFAAIAKQCLNRDHKERPSIAEVVKQLEVALHQQQNSKQHEARVAKTPTVYGFMEEFEHLKVRLEDIQLATNNFSEENLIGRGGFGNVYKGKLSLPEGQSMVFFKRLDRRLGQGNAEFWSEILFLSECKHENLVSIFKICNEGDEMILVYNYASRGSLDRYLSEPGVTWIQRLKICVGIARAMNYLHDPPDKRQKVLNGDIECSNILLDEDWTAKVSGFGQLQIGPIDPLPMYLSYTWRDIRTEAIVYSLGVLLFELICGRLCTEYSNGHLTLFVPKWIRCYDEKRLDEVIFSDLKEQMDSCSLNTFSSIAYRCLNSARKERPTMAAVLKELEIALEQQEDFEEMMRIKNLVISPASNTSRNQDFLRFPKGVLVGDGNTWLSKFMNGKVCEVISAAKCISADSLVHDDRQKSRFQNVVKGQMHNGFSVEVTTQFLSPKITYTVNLVFKHKGRDHLARSPFKFIHKAIDHGTHIPFKFKLEEERYYSNSCMAHVRDDGWLMIELHQFTSYKKEHDLKINFLPLFDITSSSIEYYFEGVEFRPVQYVT